MRPIHRVIIHCSATPPDLDVQAGDIRRWHVEGNGWSDIGYHYVITRTGKIQEGRPIEQEGAHVYGHNEDSIGICMVGGVNEEQKPDCNFSRAQWHSLQALVTDLVAKYNASVHGHREYSDKACPCFNARMWWYG